MKTGIAAIMIGLAGFVLASTAPANAAGVSYYPDPVYKRLNDDDPQPMEEMLELAGEGDPRAQYILGDMYQKGKGGLAKSAKESRRWLEESAMHGYGQSFIRLAAQAKRDDNAAEAWQWYTLAIDALSGKEEDFAIQARKDLVDEYKLTREDISAARKAMNEWKDQRDQKLRDEASAAKKAPAEKASEPETAKHDQPEEKKNNEQD